MPGHYYSMEVDTPSHPCDRLVPAHAVPEDLKALLLLAECTLCNNPAPGTTENLWPQAVRPGIFRLVKVIDHDYDTLVYPIGAQYVRGLDIEAWRAVLAQYVTDVARGRPSGT